MSIAPPNLPEPAQSVLAAYLRAMDQETPSLLACFYLHGSLALRAFNAYSSDIDFVAVLSRHCTPQDIEHLRHVHTVLAREHPVPKMEGSYRMPEDLGRFEETILPGPCCKGGVFYPEAYHDINSVTWWVLKNRGITLHGVAAQDLDFTVDMGLLVEQMYENLNTYWRNYLIQPRRIATLWTDDGIEWMVLGVLRQYYTFRENDITSKTGAGEYALAHLPARWHQLIREALALRAHTEDATYQSRTRRAIDAWLFLNYLIPLCNTLR